jgi:hypothetical protein
LPERILSRRFVLPTLILLSFALVAAFVNYRRWGDALVFADYRLYIMNAKYPDRLLRTAAYGLFNLFRVPFGILYYFFPIWVIRRGDGHLLFEEHQWRLIDATELPPSSFFLTDPLFVLLLLYAGWSLLTAQRSAGISRLRALAIGAGFLAPCLLMLAAISMNFRYRMEFYPLIEFGGFLGFLALCRSPLSATSPRRVCTLPVACAAVGILGSHLIMILYKLSDFGPAIERMHLGIYTYYVQQFHLAFPSLARWIAN